MKKIAIFLMMVFVVLSTHAYALTWQEYKGNVKRNLIRGTVNVVSSPLEIPLGISRSERESSSPIIFRHVMGFGDGLARALTRAGAGIWDFAVMFIPAAQDGYTLEPETLF